jgi:AcrR family transcriptional regulator
VSESTRRTRKGERTREHILDTAIDLFISKGYHVTTMRDIATTAECSLGLTYRYFARKEDIVLALYQRLAQQFEAQVSTLSHAPMAARFEQLMQVRLAQIQPYRELFRSILGAALSPQNDFAILGTYTADARAHERNAFVMLVSGATDAPKEQQARDLGHALHAAHMCLLLFWFYDHTPDYRATTDLLELARDMLKLVRRLLRLPPAASALARLARVIDPVFGSRDDE